MKNNTFTAVAYARFSSNNQRDESIDAQLRAIRDYCNKENIEILEVFTDEAQTGQNDDRDNFRNMIDGIMLGDFKVDAILVHKFNRFARNKYDSAIYKKKLKDNGVRVISVTQNIEETPEGAMMESFLEAMDEYYSANLSLEIQKGIRENALNGKNNGGRVPLGFTITENGQYIINEQAAITKRIFEDYANGISKITICNRLNAAGLRNQYGRPFNQRTLSNMLQNEKFIGNLVFTLNGKEKIRHNGKIPQIIDLDLWNRVQEVRKTIIKRKCREESLVYPFTGKMFCSECGEPYIGGGFNHNKDGTIRISYRCRGRTTKKNGCQNFLIQKGWVEQEVFRKICDEVFSEEKILAISEIAYSEIVKNSKKPATSISALKSELKSIHAMQTKLTQLYLANKMSIEILDAENETLTRRKHHIETELNSRAALSDNGITLKKIQGYFTDFVDEITSGEMSGDEFQNSVFDTFLEKIILSPESVKVVVKVNFNDLKKGCDKRKNAPAIFRLPHVTLNEFMKRPKSYSRHVRQ